MGLFKRISDIISANLNELTEQFDDPELGLKQAIREMEESIRTVTAQTAKTMASEKTVTRELERNRQHATQWGERASQAVEAGDDDLARRALTRKKEHEKLAAALEDQLGSTREACATLKRQLDGMRAKLAEAKRSLAALSARKRAAELSKRMSAESAGYSTEYDESGFAKFDRLKTKVEEAEAEAEAWRELRAAGVAGGSPAVEEELETNDESLDVDAELAELKRKVKQ